jgi:acetolactate synthase I/II/III large subunit
MAEQITIQVENTAQAYLEFLRAMGVKYFFGNAGTDFASIIDSFAKFAVEGKTTPRPIQVPHEFCAVKKSLESDYPRPQAGAFRPIHGYATAISV